MKYVVRWSLLLAVLGTFAPLADAQSRPSSYQRHEYVAADSSLDSLSIQLRVVDFETGEPVPALICLGRSGRHQVVTNSEGAVRVSNLPQTNVSVRVLATGYDPDSLIFFPGKRGRSQARVRLVPNAAAPAEPTCCATPSPPSPSTLPSVTASAARPLLTRADTIAAMCAHDPRVEMRLYGCNPRRGPLFIIDGVLLPSDSSRASREWRDSVSAAQRGREVVELILAPANDSSALANYGSRARDGLVILWTRPRR